MLQSPNAQVQFPDNDLQHSAQAGPLPSPILISVCSIGLLRVCGNQNTSFLLHPEHSSPYDPHFFYLPDF